MADIKAKDFSESAENLTNPDEVRTLLNGLHTIQLEKANLEAKLREESKELVEAIEAKEGEIKAVMLDLKGDPKNKITGAIENYGSYQDTENEHYAVRYRNIIKSYHVEPFKEQYRKYVTAVIVESINVQALKGLIKGGLILEADLKDDTSGTGLGAVMTETIQYSYYVR
jgi:hypothetical protein